MRIGDVLLQTPPNPSKVLEVKSFVITHHAYIPD
jgi:hypothetical protein